MIEFHFTYFFQSIEFLFEQYSEDCVLWTIIKTLTISQTFFEFSSSKDEMGC